MSTSENSSQAPSLKPLGASHFLWRSLAVVVIVVCVATTFAYAGGWLSPGTLTPARFVNTLEQIGGKHPGYRRNHARGLGVNGYFESNGNGEQLSRSTIFRAGKMNVIGRFSLSGGDPHAPDKSSEVRGLGLQFTSPDGQVWRTAMINLPVFPVQTPEAFHDMLLASQPDPATGKPDPNAMQTFAQKHPDVAAAKKIIQQNPISTGFANTTFHGLNAFYFVNSAGKRTPVRWILQPEQSFVAPDPAATSPDPNFLFHDLADSIHHGSLRWRLKVIVGEPGDPTDNASVSWPASREQIELGTLVLDAVEQVQESPADKINFDPLTLPDGIEPSDDPLLSARSAVYSQSFTRRAGETRQHPSPSEIPQHQGNER
ncbi:catalase family peroxidase [Blastopirellula marina]|uniref:Catalase-related peroxidase n=1 Tax=Blastopirellula marina TaxID=124 RepID=A0A2S8FNW5_9BACT|nr:catalase family peroxidase [Blastopirellula marina]PQO33680.1 catalase [Blastopirellula marina]PTL43467.1 catalase [Blastopirellula marina]